MSDKPKKILVLSSGGDSPGMNAAIRAVVRSAHYYDIEIVGSHMGYRGLIEKTIFPLKQEFVSNSIQRGGTILKTDRCPEFKGKTVRDQCREYLNSEGIDGMVVLGGNGSFAGATVLQEEGGPRALGIPCTIDNDIVGTDYCIGFDTACNTALEAIDRIRDTALSLERNFLIEVMGRASGFIAVAVGIAGGADIILTPEFPVGIESLVKKIKYNRKKRMASIIVVAEADKPGSSVQLASEIEEAIGVKYRVCILGHTQRGGTPTVKDRKVGSLMGIKAVQALMAGESKKMIAMLKDEYVLTSFPDINNAVRFFDDEELLKLNSIICEF